ncbi:hypothetical protein IWQ60_006870 [Tieghemiomyces parasiticus]|uniref:VPS37 C-terminal domain-containing protein n=1 Tax=Tieghemiomyces parasiticus TaxID=78921 RepID=A0A9W8A4K8_9FUNG|nr:hypothetical protein IWQ60_006870 [Tieghemiomyces parasiticus]
MSLPEAMNNYGLPDETTVRAKQDALRKDFPTFANKSAEDLQDILTYEDLFLSYFNGLDQVQMTKTVQLELEQGNEALSRRILNQEPDLAQLRQTIVDQQAVLDSLTTNFYERIKTQLDVVKPFAPSQLLGELQREVDRADRESDAVAQTFLYERSQHHAATSSPAGGEEATGTSSSVAAPGMDHDQFIRQFKNARKQYHLLTAKLERTRADPATLDGLPTHTLL